MRNTIVLFRQPGYIERNIHFQSLPEHQPRHSKNYHDHHRHPPSIQLSHHQHTNNNNKIIPPIKPLSSIRIGRMTLIVIFILLLITFYLLLLYSVNSSCNDTYVVDLIIDSWDRIGMQRSITIRFFFNRMKMKNWTLISYWVLIEYQPISFKVHPFRLLLLNIKCI